ncbi:vWA domain-containing protein [Mycobacterium sp. NPDC051198]
MVHNLKPAGDLRPIGGKRRLSWKRLLLAILLPVLLVALPLWWWSNRDNPNALRDTFLAGERGPGCVRVTIASDESGSMHEFIAPRDQALAQLLEWAPGNLRADDELGVLAFSGDTYTAMSPTAVGDHPALHGIPDPTNGTSFAALVNALKSEPQSGCTQSLILLSDGKFHDFPQGETAARATLKDAGVSELFLLVPGKDIEVAPKWPGLFPYATPVVFDGTDPDKTGLAFGRTLAGVTGQKLEMRSR